MKPQNAVVKIHHKRKYPYAMSCDGNTPIYETVCIDMHLHVYTHGEKVPYLHVGERCRVCGRMAGWRDRTDMQEPPKGMPFYVVPDWTYLWDNKVLPEEMRVG